MPKAPAVGKTGKGVILNQQGAADTFGVALTTVGAWIRAGCPVEQRGSRGVEWKLNSRDLHLWVLEQKVAQATGDKPKEADDVKLRKLEAEAELLELELAKKKEEVVELPMVQRALAAAFADIQARLRNLPGRLAGRLLNEKDEARWKSVMLDEIDQSLEHLATLDLTGLAEEEAEDDEEALDE